MDKTINLLTSDGFHLAAIHNQSSLPKAVLLSLHGITSQKDGYLDFKKDLAADLAKNNIDSLRFDFRGHGESDGTSLDFTVAGQSKDTNAALNYLFDNYTDATPLFVMGSSFGGPPALKAAGRNSNILGVILFVPVLSYQRTFLQPEAIWSKSVFNSSLPTHIEQLQPIIGNDFPISQNLYDEMVNTEIETIIQYIDQPVLIIHGDQDSMVPYDVSKEFSTKHKNVTLKTIYNMDHGFMRVGDTNGTHPESINNKQTIFSAINDFILENTYLNPTIAAPSVIH